MATATKKNLAPLTLRPQIQRGTDEPDQDLLLYGEHVGTVYFNLSGYRGSLPAPDGIPLDPGEKGLSTFRRHVRDLNREWKDAEAQAPDQEAFRRSAVAQWQGRLA